MTRDQIGHYLLKKNPVQSRDIKILHLSALKIASTYGMQKSSKVQEEMIMSLLKILTFFLLWSIVQADKIWINNYKTWPNRYRILYSIIKEYTLFPNVCGTLTKNDHVLGHKVSQ